ncbi:MAG: hypothetical protein HKO65_13585 [Gemmatimonadetes bacterium]|nr:hypothetical protein [Gemmatimonadota bacterium]NNM06115.1 hypothetical protein [Gemmatimonadota bacterium]
MKHRILAVAILLAVGGGPLSAQEGVRERARENLPTQVFESIDALATEVGREGIPAEPLFNKALEGLAKRVPSDRLLPAVTRYAGQLRMAREAFGGLGSGPLYVAGADALQRGVEPELLSRLGQREGDSPGASPMAVLVLADLVEAGVPADRALGMVREALRMRTGEQQMLGMTARVRQLMRQGQSPQDAAEQVRRSLQRGRGGGVGPPVPPGSEPSTKGRRQGGNGRGGGR